VIISPDGYIVTNNHVIEGAVDIRVTMSNREVLSAKLVGADPLTDLAVIRSMEPICQACPGATRLNFIRGRRCSRSQSYGYRFTVTRGIISALNRPILTPATGASRASSSRPDAAIIPEIPAELWWTRAAN